MKLKLFASLTAAIALSVFVSAAVRPDQWISSFRSCLVQESQYFPHPWKRPEYKGNILTLQEAMDQKLFVVYETAEVNELEVENLSKEFDVFIQSGDIVKGGRQDRVLAVSIIIPALVRDGQHTGVLCRIWQMDEATATKTRRSLIAQMTGS